MAWKNTTQSWGWISITIHWVTAITVIGLFILGLWMVELTYYDDWYRTAPDLHKSIGITLFILTLFRLIWRLKNATPEPIASHTAVEKRAAAIAHGFIYVLLFLIMVSGYLISTADGRAIEVFGLFSVPATLQGIDQQEDIAGVVHLVLAITLIVLVVVHAAGALKHHFIDKDSTLKRMLSVQKN